MMLLWLGLHWMVGKVFSNRENIHLDIEMFISEIALAYVTCDVIQLLLHLDPEF